MWTSLLPKAKMADTTRKKSLRFFCIVSMVTASTAVWFTTVSMATTSILSIFFQFKKKMNEKSLNLRQKGATTAASSSKIFGRTNELDTRPVDRMHPREPFEKKRHETNDFTQPPTDGPWHQLTCRPHTKVTAKPTLRPKRPIYRRRLPLGSRQGRKTSENLSKRGFFTRLTSRDQGRWSPIATFTLITRFDWIRSTCRPRGSSLPNKVYGF